MVHEEKKVNYHILIDSFPYHILTFLTTTRKTNGQQLNKSMKSPIFVDDENISLVTHHGENIMIITMHEILFE